MIRLLLALSACLLLSACDGGGNDNPQPRPAPIQPPVQQPIGPTRKEFFYFTAKAGDLEETRDHVTLVWAWCWGGASQADSGMPLIGEFAQCVFDGDSIKPDAAQLLRAMFDGYKADGFLQRIAKLYIDEPSQSGETLGRGVSIVRSVMAEYPELANSRMMICIGDEGAGKESYVGMEHFDDCDVDAYGERARIIEPNGRIDRLRARLRPDQRYYITLGLNTGVTTLSADEIMRIADYALADPWCGGVDGFTWFDRVQENGSLGARSQPELRAACIEAGRKFIAANKNQTGATP